MCPVSHHLLLPPSLTTFTSTSQPSWWGLKVRAMFHKHQEGVSLEEDQSPRKRLLQVPMKAKSRKELS